MQLLAAGVGLLQKKESYRCLGGLKSLPSAQTWRSKQGHAGVRGVFVESEGHGLAGKVFEKGRDKTRVKKDVIAQSTIGSIPEGAQWLKVGGSWLEFPGHSPQSGLGVCIVERQSKSWCLIAKVPARLD